MPILQLFPAKDFFTACKFGDYSAGQLCRIVAPFIMPIPQILDVERAEPQEHREVKYRIRNANSADDFRRQDRTLPLYMLNLRSGEELLIQRAKKRPGIILSNEVDSYQDMAGLLRQEGKKHLQEDSIFVVPLYSLKTEYHPQGFPPEMVDRVRSLLYRQFFYVPSSAKTNEGVARFDRIQVIAGKDRMAIEPLDVCLSDEAFGLFVSLFKYCVSGEKDEDLSAIIQLVREKLQLT